MEIIDRIVMLLNENAKQKAGVLPPPMYHSDISGSSGSAKSTDFFFSLSPSSRTAASIMARISSSTSSMSTSMPLARSMFPTYSSLARPLPAP